MDIIEIIAIVFFSGLAGANLGMCYMTYIDYANFMDTGESSPSLYTFQKLTFNGQADWECSLLIAGVAAYSIVIDHLALGLTLLVLQISVLITLGLSSKVAKEIDAQMARRRGVSRG